MNYMEQIAKMLGVELGEEFEVVSGIMVATYKFTEMGLYDFAGRQARGILDDLLNGTYKIKRKTWKPNKQERYFVPTPAGFELFYIQYYQDLEHEKDWIEKGLVFRTKEEAVEAAKKMLKALEG